MVLESTEIREAEKRWGLRLRRAQELCDRHQAAGTALRFYAVVLTFQMEVARSSNSRAKAGIPLRAQIDSLPMVAVLPSLLAISIKDGPDTLRAAAQHLQEAGETGWRELLESAIGARPHNLTRADDFFARACLQPVAEHLQLQIPKNTDYSQRACPLCQGLPQMSVLRPEAEGASRSLVCSFCLNEWSYRRLECPWCGEEDKEKLPRYSAQEVAHVHVEACDTCKRYLKAVDMTIDGLAVPLVDEAALAVLDVWASDHGYQKIVRNLIGF